RELADVDAVGELPVSLARPLRVVARQYPVALAIGDQRGLEVGGTDRPEVFHALRKLERALDIVPRSFEVALALPAARAPREDVRLEGVARQAGTLGEGKRFVEERQRRLHACELVAAAAEPEQHVGPLDIGEGFGL